MQRLKMHPDLGGDHWHAAVINEAYATLTDAARREAYDRELEQRETAAGEPQPEPANDNVASEEPPQRQAGHCPLCREPHGFGDDPSEEDCRRCLSPLDPAGEETSLASARRAIERFPRTLSVRFCAGWPGKTVHHARVLDMSPAGMRLTSDTALPLGKLIRLDCDLFTAVAEVRRCQSGGTGHELGVSFVTLRFRNRHGNFVSVSA